MTCIIIESPFLVELPSRSCFLRRPFLRLRRATLNNWVVISIVYDLPMAKWYQMQWFISINQHFEAEVLSIMAYIYIPICSELVYIIPYCNPRVSLDFDIFWPACLVVILSTRQPCDNHMTIICCSLFVPRIQDKDFDALLDNMDLSGMASDFGHGHANKRAHWSLATGFPNVWDNLWDNLWILFIIIPYNCSKHVQFLDSRVWSHRFLMVVSSPFQGKGDTLR
jgi:hypothetical protein